MQQGYEKSLTWEKEEKLENKQKQITLFLIRIPPSFLMHGQDTCLLRQKNAIGFGPACDSLKLYLSPNV
jgi:hypothetical protein